MLCSRPEFPWQWLCVTLSSCMQGCFKNSNSPFLDLRVLFPAVIAPPTLLSKVLGILLACSRDKGDMAKGLSPFDLQKVDLTVQCQ